jgi:hypothetical protein
VQHRSNAAIQQSGTAVKQSSTVAQVLIVRTSEPVQVSKSRANWIS